MTKAPAPKEKRKRRPVKIWHAPTGETVRGVANYIKSWKSFVEPILEPLELQLSGIDPDYLLSCTDNFDRSISLPVWFVHRLVKALKKKGVKRAKKSVG